MFLFKKRNSKLEAEKTPITARVIVIPEAFYGGADPVIHYAGELTKLPNGSAAPVSKIPLPVPGAKKKSGKNKKGFFIGGGIFFLLFVGVTTWYYLGQEQAARSSLPVNRPAQTRTTPKPDRRIIQQTPTTTQETVATPSIVPPTTTARIVTPELGQFPRIFLADSADLDSDTLTDTEEEAFGTDSGVWDTDADGYYDGQEVVNLYNPVGFAPVKIIDSGLTREYVHPTLGYRIYFPAPWESAAVDERAEQVIFSAVNGDFVEVRVFEKSPQESFETWFGRAATGQVFSDLIPISNRFGVDGWRRKDNLVAYYETDHSVVVLLYHPGGEEAIFYRHVMIMMRESFRTGALPRQ